jgi:hypothetical protein
MTIPLIERLLARSVFQNNGCWIWTGATDAAGYGQKVVLTHRLMYEIAYSQKPSNFVLHRCDNPSCFRPSHLFDGTAADNSRDMMVKGRSSAGKPRPSERGANHYTKRRGLSLSGEHSPSAKLTQSQVAQIRREYSPHGRNGKSGARLARELGVHISTVQKVASGRNWST